MIESILLFFLIVSSAIVGETRAVLIESNGALFF
jgi:hypothetical protein